MATELVTGPPPRPLQASPGVARPVPVPVHKFVAFRRPCLLLQSTATPNANWVTYRMSLSSSSWYSTRCPLGVVQVYLCCYNQQLLADNLAAVSWVILFYICFLIFNSIFFSPSERKAHAQSRDPELLLLTNSSCEACIHKIEESFWVSSR